MTREAKVLLAASFMFGLWAGIAFSTLLIEWAEQNGRIVMVGRIQK